MSLQTTNYTPPPYLSPSSIGTFQNCQLKFKYNKIDLIPDKPTRETLLGNFVHDGLETLYKYPANERTPQQLKFVFSDLWTNGGWVDRVKELITSEDDIRSFRWQAWWHAENLWKIEDPMVVEPSGLEHELNGQIAGVQMKGFIDRYSYDGEKITISDYKTGKTPKKLYVDDKFTQLIIYASLLIDEMSDQFIVAPTTNIELLYLKDGVKFEKTVSDSDIKSVSVDIRNTKELIDKACETGVFEPNQSILCNWCGYKTICPVWVK